MVSRNRGAEKKNLRKLSADAPLREEIDEVWKTLASIPHAVTVAILGASLVEYELETLLKRHFLRKDEKTWRELIGDHGPIATLSTKILLGFALGIYDENTRKILNSIRGVRNAFAHSKKIISFSHGIIEKELMNLPIPKKASAHFKKCLEDIKKKDNQGPAAFVVLCMAVSRHFQRLGLRTREKSINRKMREFKKKHPLAAALL